MTFRRRNSTRGGTAMYAFTMREGVLAGGILASLIWAMPSAPAIAEQQAAPADFSSNQAGWISIGGDLIEAPGARVSIVRTDPAHPYVPNGTGAQPTYRIADLSNPNLKPWVKERMQKDNDEVRAGKIAFTPRSSCRPAGVPAFMTYSRFEPIYFIQTPKQVTMIFAGDAQVRRVYLDVLHSE